MKSNTYVRKGYRTSPFKIPVRVEGGVGEIFGCEMRSWIAGTPFCVHGLNVEVVGRIDAKGDFLGTYTLYY